jgi:hypothetical protein
VIEGILNELIAAHRKTFAGTNWEGEEKEFN